MGWCISRIQFENEFPSMAVIRKQFKKQTGEGITIIAQVNILKLSSDSREVLEQLNEDIDRYEKYVGQGFNEDINKVLECGRKINHIDYFQFTSPSFYEIDFSIKGNVIELGFGIGCKYFPNSLHKVFIDLGGKFVDSDWSVLGEWSKLKHWKDYKWYNRPKK